MDTGNTPHYVLAKVSGMKYERLIATLWFIRDHPDKIGRVNLHTLTALTTRRFLIRHTDPKTSTHTYELTNQAHAAIDRCDPEKNPDVVVIYDGFVKHAKAPIKVTGAKAAKPKTVKTSEPDAKKALAGLVMLHPRLVNHPDIDPFTVGVIAWCAAQTVAPTIAQIAARLGSSEAYVKLLIKDIREAGFDIRVGV